MRRPHGAFKPLYPKTTLKANNETLQFVKIDPGTEFRGDFEEELIDREVTVTRSLPRRSPTHAREERWHRTLQEGVRTVLTWAGAPLRLWGYALLHWVFNYNRENVKDEYGVFIEKSPFHKRYGHMYKQENLVNFGVGCIVFDDNVTRGEKFNPRGYEGAVVGYGPFPGVYKVIDPSKLRETGIVNIVTTRDVKIKHGTYPMRKMGFRAEFTFYDTTKTATYGTCPECKKQRVSEAEPVTCLRCKNSAVRHSDDAGCLRQRCECARGHEEDLDAYDEEDAFEVLHMPAKKRRAPQGAPDQGAPQKVRLEEILEDAPQEDGDERRQEAPEQPEQQQT